MGKDEELRINFRLKGILAKQLKALKDSGKIASYPEGVRLALSKLFSE